MKSVKNEEAEKRTGKFRRKGIKGILCSVFAASGIVLAGSQAAYLAGSTSMTPPGVPHSIDVLGARAEWMPVSPDDVPMWSQMMQRQLKEMQDPVSAMSFKKYRENFDQYKSEDISKMAADVNKRILSDIAYSRMHFDFSPFYWASPAQTQDLRLADCKGYAIMQYFIMQHLGVSKDRMLLALVGIGDNSAGLHVVLLVNKAPDGQKPDYIVMDDAGPVLPANGTVFDAKEGPYELIALINEKGFWARNPAAFLGDEFKALGHDVLQVAKAALAGIAKGLMHKGFSAQPDVSSVPKPIGRSVTLVIG